MGAKLGGSGAISDINMTPLIDIVLVVLIIMMVNVPIQIQEMGVKLPSDQPPVTPPPPDVEQLVIALYEDDTVALNRVVMKEENLVYEITRRIQAYAKKVVFIDAAPKVKYGRVVDMMDVARESGASTVGLAKMKPGGPLPATEIAQGGMPRGIYLGSPTTVGAMQEVTAAEAIKPLKAQIESCYAQALGRKPTTTGRIVLRVEVGPQGELMRTGISSSTVEEPELEKCVEPLAGRLRYEPLGDQNTALVQYPILFSPG
jgi:biopolymer transport protein ExbD